MIRAVVLLALFSLSANALHGDDKVVKKAVSDIQKAKDAQGKKFTDNCLINYKQKEQKANVLNDKTSCATLFSCSKSGGCDICEWKEGEDKNSEGTACTDITVDEVTKNRDTIKPCSRCTMRKQYTLYSRDNVAETPEVISQLSLDKNVGFLDAGDLNKQEGAIKKVLKAASDEDKLEGMEFFLKKLDEFEKQVNTTCEKVHGADEISKGKCVKGAAKLTNGEGKGVREAVEKVITIKKDLKAAKSMSMTALKLRANLYYAKGQAAMKGYSYSSALKAFHKQEPCVAYWMTDEQQICGNENKRSKMIKLVYSMFKKPCKEKPDEKGLEECKAENHSPNNPVSPEAQAKQRFKRLMTKAPRCQSNEFGSFCADADVSVSTADEHRFLSKYKKSKDDCEGILYDIIYVVLICCLWFPGAMMAAACGWPMPIPDIDLFSL